MTSLLPPNLLKLFAPRPPLPYAEPLDKEWSERPPYRISGIGEMLERCKGHDTDYVPTESFAQRKERKLKERTVKAEAALKKGLESWDPTKDPNVTADPYKTLFIGRLSYETDEAQLIRDFEMYGQIKKVRVVRDPKTNKSLGYGFIEFVSPTSLKTAYKDADAIKIQGRRILVDVERGRTVPKWRPKKLGGGLGKTRAGGKAQNSNGIGREVEGVRELPGFSEWEKNALLRETMSTQGGGPGGGHFGGRGGYGGDRGRGGFRGGGDRGDDRGFRGGPPGGRRFGDRDFDGGGYRGGGGFGYDRRGPPRDGGDFRGPPRDGGDFRGPPRDSYGGGSRGRDRSRSPPPRRDYGRY